MRLGITTAALACAALIGAGALAHAQSQSQSNRNWNQRYQRSYSDDYDTRASLRDSIPANRVGAGMFSTLSPPAGGIGRVDSHTQGE